MIFAIGHDIVENERIARLLDAYGQQFIDKILSNTEQMALFSRQNKARFIAKRFAAKEAFAKACGTGLRSPILMPQISVTNDALGKPSFVFTPAINQWLHAHQIIHCHLSLSDEINLSSAFVILER